MYILFGGHILQPLAGHENLPFDFAHAFLLLSNDTTPSDDDHILRGGPSGAPFVNSTLQIEVDQYFDITSRDHPYQFEQATGIADWQNYYSYSVVNIGDRNAEQAWSTMKKLATQIHDRELTYNTINENSNAFVRTMLESVDAWATPTPTPAGYELTYPGGDRTLVDDIFKGSQGWNIQGTNGDDHVYALFDHNRVNNPNNGDHVLGYGGDDQLYSGNRSDVLEGGEGNDTYILESDYSTKDIVVIGSGNDTIIGGENDDRIVLRLTDLNLSNSALSASELPKTAAIPLLGGFRDPYDSTTARWYGASETLQGTNVYEGLEIMLPSVAPVSDSPIWSILADNSRQLPFEIGYTISGSDLMIRVDYEGSDGNYHVSTVTVRDFQEGDFGIQFFNETAYGYSERSYYQEGPGGTDYYVQRGEGIDHINNNGSFVELPNYVEFA